jgi:hypothetical protein
MTIVPDTKDWTWVLRDPCPECGYDATTVDRADLGARIRASAAPWAAVLARPDAAERPSPGTWSPLEYACHVRDVHRIFVVRLAAMLEQETPHFANWDQDATAVEDRYAEQDPPTVAEEVAQSGEAVAARFDAVAEDQWELNGVRSDGSVFTVETLGQYLLHDLEHHVWDVSADPAVGK